LQLNVFNQWHRQDFDQGGAREAIVQMARAGGGVLGRGQPAAMASVEVSE